MSNSPLFRKSAKLNKKEIETKNKYVNELKNFLNSCQTFAEYFVLIGIDPKISMRDYLYNSSPSELKKYYSNEIKPEILSKYPPMEKSYINITSSLIDICFPDGFNLEEHGVKPNTETMNFLLDNYYYSIEHPYKYVTCVKFYENLYSYYNLKNEIQKQSGKKYDKKILKYDGCLSNTNKFLVGTVIEEELDKSPSCGSNKSDKGTESIIEKVNEFNLNNYYFPKVICLISIEPFYKEQKLILNQIYQYHLIKAKIPIEKIILNILCNIPMPPKGLLKIIYKLSDNEDKIKFGDIEIERHEMNKLRNVDTDLIFIFSKFKFEEFLNLFKFTLYETKTLVFSSIINNLSKFINCLIDLLFPFKYSFQVCSCVPNSTFNLLESISPYILGINQKYVESFFSDNHIETKGLNIIIVDLDNKEIKTKLVEKFPEIPKSLRGKLKERIEECHSKRKIQNNDEYYSMGTPFFEFFVSIMDGYDNYLNCDYFKNKMKYKSSSINALFKCKDFVNSKPSNERNFYQKIVESQMFSDFILKRMIPKDRNDKIDILFLDEHITKKNNEKKSIFKKKKSLVFLNSKEYEHKHIYNVFKPKELSAEEKLRYENKDYRVNSLYLGQNIETKKGEQENETEFFFNYLLFPKLNNDFFNMPNYEYFFNLSLSDINRINSDLISKSHLDSMEIDEGDMLNYLYLTYLEVWGYSYYYQDNAEKNSSFKELLKILGKVYHHELELFNLLFETLDKFQENEKIMQLYNKLIEYKMTPSSYIHSLVSKIINTKKRLQKLNQNSIDHSSVDSLIPIPNSDICNNNSHSRTFHNAEESYILGDLVIFTTSQNCPECGKLIDIENISMNFKNMQKDSLWAKCPFCNKYILPQLKVKLGNEINSEFNQTSKVTTFILHSPYELKNNIKETIDMEMLHILEVDKFKLKYPSLFWSCIWYFKLNKINYDIILPYVSNVSKSKTTSNKFIIQTNVYSKITKEREKKDNEQKENDNKIVININKKKKKKNKYFKCLTIHNIISFYYTYKKCHQYYGEFKNNIKIEIDERRNTVVINHKNGSIPNILTSYDTVRNSMKNNQIAPMKKLSGRVNNKCLFSDKKQINFNKVVSEENEDQKISDFDKNDFRSLKSEELKENKI